MTLPFCAENRQVLAENRQVLAEKVSADTEAFVRLCLKTWNSADQMADDLALFGWPVSVRKCCNWRNRSTTPKYDDVQAVKHLIELKTQRQKREAVAREIQVLEVRLALKRQEMLA